MAIEVSLTVNGLTFTFENGEVDKVGESIQTGIDNTEVTQAGPMGSYNYDFEGVKKIITINGFLFDASSTRVPGYTITTRLAQKQWLESLANGSQDNISFDSNYASQSVLGKIGAVAPMQGTFTSTLVMIDAISWGENTKDPERLQYQITLKVGQA